MKALTILLVMLAVAHVGFAQGPVTAIKCGRLIDGRSDTAIESAVILIEGNRIKEVGKNLTIPRNAKIIDLSNATVLPGLIDAHTHILLQGDITAEDYAVQILKESIPYRALRASLSCKTALLNGFTTLRDMGTEGSMYADVDLKKAINNGVIDGPRLFVSGRAINSTGHYLLPNKEYAWYQRDSSRSLERMKRDVQSGKRFPMAPTGSRSMSIEATTSCPTDRSAVCRISRPKNLMHLAMKP
jgi:imidazolonepropionase-like amidohydrolase